MMTWRPLSTWKLSWSRHSTSPAASRARQDSANCLSRPVARTELAQVLADAALEFLAEDRARRAVRGAHAQVGLERDHAGGEAREDHGEVRALGLGRLLRADLVRAGAAQPLGHVVEGMDEEAHLIVRRERQSRVEVALGHRPGSLHEVLDRLHQLLRGEDRPVPGREQRQQQHDRERQDEAGLERRAQVVLLAELLVGCLHGVRERTETLGDRVHGLEHETVAARQRLADRHCRAHEVSAARLRLEAHERAPLPELQQHLAGHFVGHDVRRKSLADRDHRAGLGRHDEFDGADLSPERLEQSWRRPAAHQDFVGDELRVAHVLAHARLEGRAAEHQRVVEAFPDLDVEPAVDALVQELHREEIHEQDRQRGQHAEDPDHARLEPRTDHVAAPVAHQLRELREQQHDQHRDAGHVDPQDPRVQAAELLGVLRGLGHEQDRGQPEQAAHAHQRDGKCAAQRTKWPYEPLARSAPVVRPEQQPLQRGRRRTEVDHGAQVHLVPAVVLHQVGVDDRQAAHVAKLLERSLQRPEVLLFAGIEIAQQVALAERVVTQLIRLLEFRDGSVRPVAAHA